MKTKEELIRENKHDFDSLVSVMAALRSEGGCPWDMEQTHTSVRKCLIEETYEVIEAIDKNDSELLCEELGDLMFQAVFHARIEEEEGRFDISDVIDGITRKMIVRHPHVFADTVVSSSDDVIVNWDNIKKEEKKIDSPSEILKRVPPYMPALLRCEKVQNKALSKFGYGIDTEHRAMNNIKECINGTDILTDEKIADILFNICSLAQQRDLDLEAMLSAKTDKFIENFENNQN